MVKCCDPGPPTVGCLQQMPRSAPSPPFPAVPPGGQDKLGPLGKPIRRTNTFRHALLPPAAWRACPPACLPRLPACLPAEAASCCAAAAGRYCCLGPRTNQPLPFSCCASCLPLISCADLAAPAHTSYPALQFQPGGSAGGAPRGACRRFGRSRSGHGLPPLQWR